PLYTPSAKSAMGPHFLHQGNGPGSRSLASNLEHFRDTPRDLIVEQVAISAGRIDGFAGWETNPRRKLTEFAAALERFEHEVFRPLVPNLEPRLRAQAENLAIAIGAGQGPAVLSAASPRLERTGDTLHWTVNAPGPLPLPQVRSMVIYPMLASATSLLAANEGDVVGLPYIEVGITTPALAVRGLPRGRTPPPREAPLTALLGPAKSALLTAIATSDGYTARTLSTDLRMPPTTVMNHLTALRKAELIHANRVGAHLTYRTTIAGRRILTAWN
ncbi:MAG: hypothetical protein ACRCXL_04085, partial [Dermatophilaceae bacterium]